MKKLLVIGALALVVLTGCDGASDNSSTSAHPTDIPSPTQAVDEQLRNLGFAAGATAQNGEQAWTKDGLVVMTAPGPNGWRIFQRMSMSPINDEYVDVTCRMQAGWAQDPGFSASAMLGACNGLFDQLRTNTLPVINGEVGWDQGSVYWLTVQLGRNAK